MIERLTITVIICTRNRLDCIKDCLLSIAQQASLPDELIIVDSSDTPMIASALFINIFNDKIFTKSKLLYRHSKPSLTYQRNIGIDLASGDIIYFFDDDVIIEPQYIKEMQRIFAGKPHFAGGSGTITNIEPYCRNIKQIMRIFFLIQRNYSSGTFTASGMPTHAYGSDLFKEVEVLGGCCCAYRSVIFKKFRFDEHLIRYAYMEDCDFSKRVSKQYKLFFNPYAKLAHMQSPLNREKILDFRTMLSQYYTYLFFKNFYDDKKIRVIPYLWSMFGLLLEAIYSTIAKRNVGYIHGYCRGIYSYMRFKYLYQNQ